MLPILARPATLLFLSLLFLSMAPPSAWTGSVTSLVPMRAESQPGAISTARFQGRRDVRRQVKDLSADLRSPHGDKRRRTIAKLAALGGKEAFELVLEALGDPEAEPADEAQLVLPAFEASVGTDRVQKELLGLPGLRSKEPLVRLRAAEALGRLTGPVSGAPLVARIDRREIETARALLWSLERLAVSRRLEGDPADLTQSVGRLTQKTVPDRVRAAAIQTLARLDPAGFLERQVDLRSIRGGEAACSVLLGLVHAGRATGALDVARAEVRAACGDDEAMVRAMAIRLVPLMEPTRSDLAALAARLESEPRVALRGQVVSALQHLTGKKHRDHAAAWAHSITALPEDWVPVPEIAEGGDSGAEEQGSAATLERLAPESDRLAVLVDFSGSLWNERADGSCRKDLLDPEMDRLLDRIEPKSRFLLVPFTGKPHPFSRESLPATKRELEAAKLFFRKANMRGQGNLYDAAQVALSEPDVDRILVLTDGAPTGGHRWNVELMGDLLLEQTRFRPVIFDFVLLDAPPPLQRAWATVAARSGGRTLCLQM